jgi:dCMP deaminase
MITSEKADLLLNPSLSEDAKNKLIKMKENHVPRERQSWDITFLHIAQEISRRSIDAQTQVGAVIVNSDKKIIGAGYNGYMKGIDDSLIPNIRPGKHEWVIHSELNAILNCEHSPKNATIYCTHQPCLNCFFAIVNSGISDIVYIKNNITTNSTDVNWEIAKFLTKDMISIREVVL